MGSSTILVIVAFYFAAVFAQNSKIAFTSVPPVVIAGQQYNITWVGGDGSAVAIVLRKGDPRNLDTIGILASNIGGNYFLWTVDAHLRSASDYALQIRQGNGSDNYSGLLTVVERLQTSGTLHDVHTSTKIPDMTVGISMTTVVSKDAMSTTQFSTSKLTGTRFITSSTSNSRISSNTAIPITPQQTMKSMAAPLRYQAIGAVIIFGLLLFLQ